MSPAARIAAGFGCACVWACVASGAGAQTVYRCGGAGRTVYQSAPCAGGREIDVADPRTDEQRQAAKEVAASHARLASKLEGERRAREAAQAAANRTVIVAVPAPAASRVVVVGRARRPHVRYFPDGTPVPPVYRAPVPVPTPAPAPRKR